MIVRREGTGVRHYVHIGTGNYNAKTARLYEDFGLMTTDEEITADVADLFNSLTGYARPRAYRKVLVAPAHMRDGLLEEIEATVRAHEAGEDARIAMKMNSLVDQRCIQALYEASQAGVRIDLNVRGICCLRPGIEGVSENIRVVSVVGQFLEHSRIYSFHRGDEHRYWIGSADLMPRNLDNRVELLAPVETAGAAGRARGHARALLRRRHVRLGAGLRRHVDAAGGRQPQRARRAARARARARGGGRGRVGAPRRDRRRAFTASC